MLGTYVLRRVAGVVPVLIGMSILVFAMVYFLPGDPVALLLGEDYTEEAAAQMVNRLGLDQPVHLRYINWLGKALSGDLGQSYFSKAPVARLLLERAKPTLGLTIGTFLVALPLAIPIGMLSAARQNSAIDHFSRVFSMLGISMPVFWLGLLIMIVFSVWLGWLPPGGSPVDHGWRAYIMPSITLGLANAALIARMTRSSMLEVLQQDYIRTAHAKGFRQMYVHYKHALGNAIIPVVTVLGVQFGSLLSGTVLTEFIFGIPGMGSLLIDSIYSRDYPVIQGAVLITALAFVLASLLVDILYALFDPRIRY